MQQVRYVQSRHAPAILAVFIDGIGIKLTMSGMKREAWNRGPCESLPGTTFNANDANWEDVTDPVRLALAREAYDRVMDAIHLDPDFDRDDEDFLEEDEDDEY